MPELEHECSLAADLDPAWAARPVEVTRRDGRTMLILTDPGGEPLDRVLERREGQPLPLTRVLRIAIGLATALVAPEQTGRMNRSIDIRSDLNSLGVTLLRLVALVSRKERSQR